MKKSDLCQISNLIDERLDVKFDEKLKNFATKDDLEKIDEKLNRFATKDDLKNLATKDDLKSFATKDDLDMAIESVGINTNKSFEEFEISMDERFDKIDKELSKKPTRDEIFDKWDNEILQMNRDIDSLKYLHKDEWKNLPSRVNIKNSI